MEIRRLGLNGPAVSALGLGCMGMSGVPIPDETQSIATIHRAIALGVTLIDTADMYGAGHNEELVGRALHGHRDKVILATKFGFVLGSDGKPVGVNGHPDYIRQACDASLRRLNVDVIDLYFQHRVDPAIQIEETIGAMADLVTSGKVRYLGLSEASPVTIRRAARVHPIAAIETEYSLWRREPEQDILPICRELGIGYVPYSPLGRGFLSGRLRTRHDVPPSDSRLNQPRFQGGNFESNLTRIDQLKPMADRKGCTLAQLALAWLLAQGQWIVPVPGTKRPEYLEENLGAMDVSLSADDLTAIDKMMPRGSQSGERYPERSLRWIDA